MFGTSMAAAYAAALLAAIGAVFGFVVARLAFADDLRQARAERAHTEHLREIWDRTEAAMQRQIDIQKQRLGER